MAQDGEKRGAVKKGSLLDKLFGKPDALASPESKPAEPASTSAQPKPAAMAVDAPVSAGTYDTLARNFPMNITGLSSDRLGFLYYADAQGAVHKLDSLGRPVLHYSPRQPASITLLEAWQGLKVLLFYRELQQVIYLDRLLADSPPLRFTIPSEPFLGYYRLACPSLDDRLWALEETSLQLQKLDLQGGRILLRTPLELVLPGKELDLVFMREYQNQLYLVVRNKGILLFDNLGNYRKLLPYTDVATIGFWQDFLAVPHANALLLYQPYLNVVKEISLPGMSKSSWFTVLNNRIYFVKDGLLLSRRLSL